MQGSLRRFLCAACRVAVYICTHCDRGQRYCAAGCARAARCQSQREADRRYERSLRGRLKHAERSRRYRMRCKSVTDQGSLVAAEYDVLSTSATIDAIATDSIGETTPLLVTESPHQERASEKLLQCSFCRRWCPPWVRMTTLRRRSSRPRHHRRERL